MSLETQTEDAVLEQESGSFSLLDQAIGATKQTESSRAEELIRTLAEEAMKGTVTWNKNLTVTFREAVEAIYRRLCTRRSSRNWKAPGEVCTT